MITVESNVVVYHWMNGPLTAIAGNVRMKDADWHVSILWRSEIRSILAGYLRDGSVSAAQFARIMAAADDAVLGRASRAE